MVNVALALLFRVPAMVVLPPDTLALVRTGKFCSSFP